MEWFSTKVDPNTGLMNGLISYGDLIESGEYKLHSRFQHAVNFFGADTLVSIVDESVGAGPLNIVVDDLDAWTTERLVVRPDGCQTDETRAVFRRAARYDSSIAISDDVTPERLQANVGRLKEILRELASPHSLVFLLDDHWQYGKSAFADMLHMRFAAARRQILNGKFTDGVQQIKGLGWGLTPSGDDFIAGLLVALHMRQKVNGENTPAIITRVHSAAQTANPFSQAFLHCASRGRVFERLKRVVLALFSPHHGELSRCTADLLAIGETSGADIAVGLICGLESKLVTHTA